MTRVFKCRYRWQGHRPKGVVACGWSATSNISQVCPSSLTLLRISPAGSRSPRRPHACKTAQVQLPSPPPLFSCQWSVVSCQLSVADGKPSAHLAWTHRDPSTRLRARSGFRQQASALLTPANRLNYRRLHQTFFRPPDPVHSWTVPAKLNTAGSGAPGAIAVSPWFAKLQMRRQWHGSCGLTL